MKNLKNKLLFTFIATFIFTFIGIVVFQSCDSNNNVTSDTIESSLEEFKIPETVSNAYVDGLKLPDGTKVIKIDDSTVEFTYPKGVELWIGDDNGNVSKKYISGGYTCTCSGENGCNVFYAGGNFGCQHATCTGTCTGKHAKITNPKDLNYVFVNTNESLVPINNDYDFENLPYIPEMVVKQEKVQNLLREFAKEIYGNNYQTYTDRVDNSLSIKSDINDIVFIQMKMHGFKFIYEISFNDLKPEVQKNNNFDKLYIGADHSCNCESGSSGCTKKKSLGVRYCEGGSCTTCKMTMS
mgnify:CR=1 FL=1